MFFKDIFGWEHLKAAEISQNTREPKMISETCKLLFFLHPASLTLSNKSFSTFYTDTVIKCTKHFIHQELEKTLLLQQQLLDTLFRHRIR